MKNNNVSTNYRSIASRAARTTHLRTGARVSSPSSGVRPGARALNLELPTSFGGAGPSFPSGSSTHIPKRHALIKPVLAVLVSLFIFNLFSHSAYAASYLNVSSGGAVSLGSIRPTSSGTSSTGSDTLTVHTDCSAGYSVYVSGRNGKDTNLTNSSADSNNTISTSSNAIGSAGSLSSNTWGLNSENTGTYVGLPTYANATNKALTTKTSVSETSTVPIYYGIKVDTSVTPGTYTGDVLYTVLMDSSCIAYTVVFDANGGSGEMANQSIMTGTATNLNMNTYTRSGYMFLGWATNSSATTPTYKDGQSVTDLAASGGTKTLYAVWGQSTGNMQDLQCTNLASGTTTYLTDTRDNQVYSVYRIPVDQTYEGIGSSTVANIAGKCLMTKDLSLGYVTGGSITRGSNLILSTDISAGEATSDAPIYARTSTSDWNAEDTDTNLQYINGPLSDYEAYSSHTYYSWGAALAVCPKGWRLPTTDEYTTNTSAGKPTTGLSAIVGNSANGSSALQAAPWDFVLGGGFYSSGWSAQGSSGGYWSSTQSSSTNAYFLFFSSKVYRGNNGKDRGRTVRCIAEDNYTINYSANGADSGEASKTSEVVYENGSVTMPTVGTMTKSGYKFKGWALTSGTSEAAYAAEETVALSALLAAASSAGQTTTVGSTITLYPVWASTIPDDGDKGNFQTTSICGTITAGHTATLTDTRDNQAYTVYRWPNTGTAGTDYPAGMAGYCIMAKDLSLGYVTGGSVTKNSNLTLTTDTSAVAATINFVDSANNSDWSTTDSDANKQYTNGPMPYDEEYADWYDEIKKHTSQSYYSFGAAQVVCPKGWLPLTNAQYNNVIATIGSKMMDAPYNFLLGGYFESSYGWLNNTLYGYYWLYTQNSDIKGDLMMFDNTGHFYANVGNNKNYGTPVRCVAKSETRTISDITYMQDINSDIVANTATSAYAQLTDSRDGSKYYVKKLPDGKVWMMQNLTIGSTVTAEDGLALTKDSTNIDNDSTYYLPPANKQSTGTITQAPNVGGAPGDAKFSMNGASDAHAKTRFRTKGTYTNDSNTGYYNFYTATLGFSRYDDDATSGSSSRDICPKGWRLPHATDAGTTVPAITTANDFTYLTRQYSTNDWSGTVTSSDYSTTNSTAINSMHEYAASPLATSTQNNYAGFSYSGNWDDNSAMEVGERGFYWSSSVYDANRGYNLYLTSWAVYPQGWITKNYGLAVRCVAKS